MFYLREVKLSDANDLFSITSNDNVTNSLNWYSHQTIEETKFIITNLYLSKKDTGLPNSYAIVLKASEKVIGIIDYHYDKNTPAIGYFLSDEYWGLGIMSHAVSQLIKIGFEEYLFERVIIAHFDDNLRSKGVIIKNGFKYLHSEQQNIKNVLRNIMYYQLTRSDYFEEQS